MYLLAAFVFLRNCGGYLLLQREVGVMDGTGGPFLVAFPAPGAAGAGSSKAGRHPVP